MTRKLFLLFVASIICSLSLSAQNICINATEQLLGNGNPALVDPWISSDPSIASVDLNGLVLGVATGSCVVTFTDEFSITTNFNITVEEILDPTIILSSAEGTDAQSLTFNNITNGDYYYNPLIPITYQVQSGVNIALGAGSTLPLGVTANVVGNVLTISGTPYTDNPINNPIVFSYSVVSDATNSCSQPGEPSSTDLVSGTITLLVPCESSIDGENYNQIICPINSHFIFSLQNGATSFTVVGTTNYTITGNTIIVDEDLNYYGASINFTITTNGQCLNNSRTVIFVTPPFPSIIDATPLSQTVCQGENITPINIQTFGNLSFSPLPTGLQWSGTNFSGSIGASGNYTINLSSNNTCETVYKQVFITVLALPTITTDGPTTICQGESVNLTSSSSSNNTWSTTNTGQSINVSSSGSYSVTVSNGTCSSTSDPVVITVNPPPVITLGNIVNPTGCGNSNGEIEILGTGSGTLTWTGTSSGSISAILPIIIPNLGEGSYDFIFDNGCLSTLVSAMLTGGNAPQTPIISASGPLSICEGDSVTLTASTGTNIEWSNSETNQSIIIHESGTYFVTVTENGCTATSEIIEIEVVSMPVAPIITNLGNDTICIGQNVSLMSNISNEIIWSPTNETSQTISVTSSGDYFVTLNVNGCSVISDTISIFVNSNLPSIPTIGVEGNLTFCEGDSVILTSSALNNNHWSNNTNNQSVTLHDSGIFTVSVIANGCEISSNPIEVVKIPLPEIPIISANGPTTFCSGNSVTLISSSSANNVWSNGESSSNIIVSSSGTYFVSTDNLGCIASSAPIEIVVNNIPEMPLILVDGSYEFCEGGSVNLSTNYTSNIEWSTGETSASINVDNSDQITATVTINNCSSTSNVINVIEFSNPIVSLDLIDEICNTSPIFGLTSGFPGGGNYLVNGVSTTTFEPLNALVGLNSVVYTLIDENACVGTIETTIQVTNCLSVEENEFAFTVFPNPSQDFIYFQSDNFELIENIELFDAMGRSIHLYSNIEGTNLLDLSIYASGVYTLKVRGAGIEKNVQVQLL
jgi:hypothetical protein